MKILLTGTIAFFSGIIMHALPSSCNLNTKSCGTQCTDYSNATPYDYLSLNLLTTMSNKFKNNIAPIANNTGTNLLDAKSVWFDLNALKRFIWEIETTVCRKKCTGIPNLNLGIRIYYARYPLTGAGAYYPQIRPLPNDYENRHTVFMVPTYDAGPAQHIDFDPRDIQNCQPRSLVSMFKDTLSRSAATAKIMAITGTPSPDGMTMNHGGLCPPVCTPGDTYFGN